MRPHLILAAALAALPSLALSVTATAAPTPANQQGMVIKGDQEAPLLLYIVPWQEPRIPEVPEADLQPVLPKVLDDDFGILRRSKAMGGAKDEAPASLLP